jgi:hypothetical protein
MLGLPASRSSRPNALGRAARACARARAYPTSGTVGRTTHPPPRVHVAISHMPTKHQSCFRRQAKNLCGGLFHKACDPE